MTLLNQKIHNPMKIKSLDFFMPGVLPNLIESNVSARRFLFMEYI